MQTRTFFLTAGLSMAAGAAAVLMLPSRSPVRKAADRAAESIEDAVTRAACRMTH